MTITSEITGSTSEAALLSVTLSKAKAQLLSLQWEVYEQTAQDPLRYGLCLVSASKRQAQIVVTGLRPATHYVYRLSDAGDLLVEGCFETSSQLSARIAA